MKIFFADQHRLHNCAGEIKDGELKPCFENPMRADAIEVAVRKAGFEFEDTLTDYGLAPIRAVHTADYIDFLQNAWTDWLSAGRTGDIFPLCWPGAGMRRNVNPSNIDGKIGLYAFDSGTPICAGTWKVAYQGAQCALNAASVLLNGEDNSFAFSRPPGHHAMPGQYGGYCFLNNAAISANHLKQSGKSKVAVLDVDYHHGNGTQAIFYDRDDILVINIHSDPVDEYPYFLGHADETGEGAGEGYNLNFPLPKGTDWQSYEPTLKQALKKLSDFEPEALVLSFGADTFDGDPLGRFKLTTDNFRTIGRMIAALNIPTVTILEGGYAIDALGDNVTAVLRGLEASPD